jgi:hypothetical protein
MSKHVTSLTLAVSIALMGAEMAGAKTYSNSPGTKKITDTPSAYMKVAPEVFMTPGPADKARLFPVSDEKGLLLSCVAPEIDKNADTDLFNNCSLAPGRTLDEVMHAFISAIHYEQSQRAKEQADFVKELEEKTRQKAASK